MISIRYEQSSPLFQSEKTVLITSLGILSTLRIMSYISQISCISPYSIPLCTILTKCPAPPVPIQLQQGLVSMCAAMVCSSGCTSGHAAALPPGIRDGPFRAPSSPPETPIPIYKIPFASTCFIRRSVSAKLELPPSIITSPSSKIGSRL